MARAAMIEGGSYAFGERVSALLGAAASPETIALVQQTLRATNPAGFMQAARFRFRRTGNIRRHLICTRLPWARCGHSSNANSN